MYITGSFVLYSSLICHPKCFQLNKHVNICTVFVHKILWTRRGFVSVKIWRIDVIIKPDLLCSTVFVCKMFSPFSQASYEKNNVIGNGKHTLCAQLRADMMGYWMIRWCAAFHHHFVKRGLQAFTFLRSRSLPCLIYMNNTWRLCHNDCAVKKCDWHWWALRSIFKGQGCVRAWESLFHPL